MWNLSVTTTRSSKRIGKRTRSRRLLFLALTLPTFSIACLTTKPPPPAEIRCPKPNAEERADFRALVTEGRAERGDDRPAVRWIGRVVGYCWPRESGEVRRGE